MPTYKSLELVNMQPNVAKGTLPKTASSSHPLLPGTSHPFVSPGPLNMQCSLHWTSRAPDVCCCALSHFRSRLTCERLPFQPGTPLAGRISRSVSHLFHTWFYFPVAISLSHAFLVDYISPQLQCEPPESQSRAGVGCSQYHHHHACTGMPHPLWCPYKRPSPAAAALPVSPLSMFGVCKTC